MWHVGDQLGSQIYALPAVRIFSWVVGSYSKWILELFCFSDTSADISKLNISTLYNAEIMKCAKTAVANFTLKRQKLWYRRIE
jgi:hypothetical protein